MTDNAPTKAAMTKAHNGIAAKTAADHASNNHVQAAKTAQATAQPAMQSGDYSSSGGCNAQSGVGGNFAPRMGNSDW